MSRTNVAKMIRTLRRKFGQPRRSEDKVRGSLEVLQQNSHCCQSSHCRLQSVSMSDCLLQFTAIRTGTPLQHALEKGLRCHVLFATILIFRLKIETSRCDLEMQHQHTDERLLPAETRIQSHYLPVKKNDARALLATCVSFGPHSAWLLSCHPF